MRFALKNPATVLAILLFAALGNVYAQAPTQPTLPRKTVSLFLPTQGTSTCPTLTTGFNCIRNVTAGNATALQSAINAATCGDTIVLAAGSTYSGNFTIPSTSCSGWIEIVSSALTSLPPSGNRVGPPNAANMPMISTANVSPAIQFLPNSNHWRFMGLEITTSYVSTSNTVYYLVAMGEAQTNQSLLPSYIIFDRDLILGVATTNAQHGIGMDGAYIGIVDSYCDEIHHNGADSQCFFAYNGPGPFLIQNSFIQAAGENIMFGGGDPAITNLVPSDITIVGNLIQKNTSWRGQASPYKWVVKNLIELKNAQRVLLDGNVIQYTWSAGQAEALILRSANQSGTCTWCVVQDVTITHNLIQHAPAGFDIDNNDTAWVAQPTARILAQNNVLDDISTTNWGLAHAWAFGLDVNTTAGTPGPLQNIVIDHNTSFAEQSFLYLGDSGTMRGLQVTNNIATYGTYGIYGSGTTRGAPTLSFFAPGYVYKNMVFITSSGTCNGNCTDPNGTHFNTQAGVDFTNYAGGNFQLKSSSRYYGAGTDGKDIGVWDWTCLNHDSAAALAGKFVPGPNGCALSVDLLLQPPTNLNVEVQ